MFVMYVCLRDKSCLLSSFFHSDSVWIEVWIIVTFFFLSFSFSGYGGPWITMISVFFQFHSIFYLLVYNWFDYYNDLVFKRDNFIMILIKFFF